MWRLLVKIKWALLSFYETELSSSNKKCDTSCVTLILISRSSPLHSLEKPHERILCSSVSLVSVE